EPREPLGGEADALARARGEAGAVELERALLDAGAEREPARGVREDDEGEVLLGRERESRDKAVRLAAVADEHGAAVARPEVPAEPPGGGPAARAHRGAAHPGKRVGSQPS